MGYGVANDRIAVAYLPYLQCVVSFHGDTMAP
jgi:hypothetical protein